MDAKVSEEEKKEDTKKEDQKKEEPKKEDPKKEESNVSEEEKKEDPGGKGSIIDKILKIPKDNLKGGMQSQEEMLQFQNIT